MGSEKVQCDHHKMESAEKVDFFEKTSAKRQILATFLLDLLGFSMGASCGWTSAALPILKSDETPLASGPITTEDASWIAAGICVGGLLGNLSMSWLLARSSQKVTLMFVAIQQIFGWLLIYYATNPMYLIISRVLAGMGAGGFYAVTPSFVSDISDDSLRGTLGSTVVFSANLGMCIQFVLGAYLDYLTIPWLMLPPTLFFMAFFLKFPDTPTFLAKKKQLDEAESSLFFYKSIKKYSKHAEQLFAEDLRKLQFLSEGDDSRLTCDDFKAKHAQKALIYGAVLMALNQFCGVFAMTSFTATIFRESGSTLSPNDSSIIVGVILIIGSMFPTLLVERLGRKAMMAISALGTSLGLAALGSYSYFKSSGSDLSTLDWVPLASFSFTIFISNWGVMTLPFMILSEISHPKIRGFVTMLCMSLLWIFAFIALKYLSALIDFMGMHGTFFLFALNSLAGALFITMFLPETKGKSFDEIVKLLEK